MKGRGFTMVELAVVLVVIGLIMAAIIKNTSLFDTAQTADAISITKDLSIAVQDFRQRYNYLPGDLPNASSTFPGVSCDTGGGNGLIDGVEYNCAPEHLFRAGLIKGGTGPLISRYGRVWIISSALANSTSSPCNGECGHLI